MNLSSASLSRIVHSSLAELCSSDGGTPLSTEQLEDVCDTRNQQNVGNTFDCLIQSACNFELTTKGIDMQEESLPASVIYSVNMDVSCSGNIDAVTNVDRSPKLCKSVKAGERAPLEVIKAWKENGFSRSVLFSVACFLLDHVKLF